MTDELDNALQVARDERERLRAVLAQREESQLSAARRALETENRALERQLEQDRARVAKLAAEEAEAARALAASGGTPLTRAREAVLTLQRLLDARTSPRAEQGDG